MRDKPVDQLLFGILEDGRICRQRARHGEARNGPRRVAEKEHERCLLPMVATDLLA